jgi:hypothetical protein
LTGTPAAEVSTIEAPATDVVTGTSAEDRPVAVADTPSGSTTVDAVVVEVTPVSAPVVIEEAVIEEVVIALPEPAVEPVAVEVVVVEEAVSVETVEAPATSTPPMATNESGPAIDSSLSEDVAVPAVDIATANTAPNEPRTASLFDSVPSPTPFAKPAETAVDATDKPEPGQVAEEDTEENQAPDDKHNV